MSEPSTTSDAMGIADARRREMAVEHILFNSLRFIAGRHPELHDELERSLDHLWDHADDGTRDDEALREIARRFLKSLRAES
jgi:hypothetical protein